MKTIVKTSRLAGQLEKLFRMLNEDFFDNQLETPIITIQSTPRAYGHYSVSPIWTVNGYETKHEINIGAGTLSRPIENVVATLLHEMCHYFNDKQGVKDCSRGNTYHNRKFKAEAEARGLVVEHSERNGWNRTSPNEALLDFVINNGLTDILINRNEESGFQITGTGTHNGFPIGTPKKSSTRKYICPCCGMSVRATREVNIACMDCDEAMVLAS